VWYNPNEREIVMENKDIDETRDIDDAQGFQFINGEWIPIFDLTPEMEHRVYAAGDIGPEGLTIAHSTPRPRPGKPEEQK
jgi:hypothetical protein